MVGGKRSGKALFGAETDRDKVRRTAALLHQISAHMAGRDGYRGISYHVTICEKQVAYTPELYLTQWILKNTVDGKKRVKRINNARLLDHLYREHIPFETENISTEYVTGVYEYKLSTSGKYRRWHRVG